jgi:hypothetical protein
MKEQDDLMLIAKELRAVVNGFKNEAINGVICVPLSDENGSPEWDAPQSRRWCARCKTRWARLFLVADRLDRFESATKSE